MANHVAVESRPTLPTLSASLELLKPITWFAPMWAFACGVVSSGADLSWHWPHIVAGILLAGPLVCGTSQAVNDWYDRHVDALNEPHRVVPSGRMPGRWALHIAIANTVASLCVGWLLGPWVLAATCFGLALAWAYSAPPLRLKRNGWAGNAAVGLCYEGLPWFTAAAAVAGGLPAMPVVIVALLYSVGAHGIMTLNDFKSIAGDRAMGIASLPASLGTRVAARLACVVMAVPQVVVLWLLAGWGHGGHAALVGLLLVAQLGCMVRLLADPRRHAAWYNATGTTLYVLGMLVAAFALRAMHFG
jgi:chlorophyll/bacteriochlorophyll a synthase